MDNSTGNRNVQASEDFKASILVEFYAEVSISLLVSRLRQ